ncbi:MAG: hypothetical protein Q4G44_03510 [Alcaligenaceae bacterium]|nr:hypothetical protein [Alcaligenaceae bacterium]
MIIKYIVVGVYGQIVLKEELLKHLKIKPGQKIRYKLLPNNKILLEKVTAEHESIEADYSQSGCEYELSVLIEEELLYDPDIYKTLTKRILH